MARGREQFLKIYKEEDGKEKGEEEEEERQREIRFRRGQEEEGDLEERRGELLKLRASEGVQ